MNGDFVSYQFEEDNWQEEATRIPVPLGIKHPTESGFYLVAESAPRPILGNVVQFARTWARIPSQQVIPSGYLFSAPNFPLAYWSSGTAVQSGAVTIAGNYAVLSVGSWYNGVPATSSVTIANGYYDVQRSITAYGANTITVPGHNYVIGDSLLYVSLSSNYNYYMMTVTGVSGNVITGTITQFAAQVSSPDPLYGLVVSGSASVRKRTRTTLDYGQTYNLTAQIIENYYLPGVSAGIASISDIPSQGPYTLASYLQAWAAGPSQWFNVQASTLRRYLGPILVQSYTQCNLAGIT